MTTWFPRPAVLLLGMASATFFCLYFISDRSTVSSGLGLYTHFYNRIFGASKGNEDPVFV